MVTCISLAFGESIIHQSEFMLLFASQAQCFVHSFPAITVSPSCPNLTVLSVRVGLSVTHSSISAINRPWWCYYLYPLGDRCPRPGEEWNKMLLFKELKRQLNSQIQFNVSRVVRSKCMWSWAQVPCYCYCGLIRCCNRSRGIFPIKAL